MKHVLGIRREDKNEWEKRVPIVPDHVRRLKEEHEIQTLIQPSPIRAFPDEYYSRAGAQITEELKDAAVVFAVKEIPEKMFRKGQTFVFFSHTIKGQSHNMAMLKKLMELKCNLIDYEKVTDAKGNRLIFFGKYAGFAGMIDTLWAYGKKLYYEGIDSPFAGIKKAIEYKDLDQAKKEIGKVAEEIRIYGFDEKLVPITFAFAGYGNVSQGAQEIFDILPHEEISPKELLTLKERPNLSRNIIYKVVFKEEHMVHRKDGKKFRLKDYFDNPEKYASSFDKYVEHLNAIVNCIYWDPRCPRFVTKQHVGKLFDRGKTGLKVIGDITCDIKGSIEFTKKCTDSGDPVFVYDPAADEISMGYKGNGIVVLAVDNLPCELPIDSSSVFSSSLLPFIPDIVKTDFSVKYRKLKLRPEIKRALILQEGELTPDFEYMKEYL